MNLIKANTNNPFHRNWLKFKNFSCRHDTFFLIYTFVIYNRVKTEEKDEVIDIYNKISQNLLQMDLEDLNKGIWELLDGYKGKNVDLTKYGYKQYFTVLQHTKSK